ncbi:structural maintenance of chromosomes flexible hinge domain-containing protein GMI1 [Diospyros lotus]|uniref:structural maintenance of chromosomes flexible hinge domain-containing protein GMI1 n=1 Tax=Diospyros lotus TaxID=55363 RepID=UPI002251097A|nr:structural maintenance of chromosomes flexible hinge domain-containing protein GMI1 [Diospyros lotus]
MNKRPSSEGKSFGWPCKRLFTDYVENGDDDAPGVGKVYKFRVLLPNGTSLGLTIRDPEMDLDLEEFVHLVKAEYFKTIRESGSPKPKRRVDWRSRNLCFVDAFDDVLGTRISFRKFQPNKYHILRLHDGSGEAETYENMWDLTPDTEMLRELPHEYSFETALADLIDNSLQAVWSNSVDERRLISVDLTDDRILIFDTGPGMDGSEENSIAKWGKIGASLHRSSRGRGIGGKPPYLMPFFGMFGYGGPIASMHLGRNALVSSKTKESKKVYSLRLERDTLLSSSNSEKRWTTEGGIRQLTEDEITRSPQGSFTKVEIFDPKRKGLDIAQLQCKLKDIYFPYIQCDEISITGRTTMPIEFQVNGVDLAEIQGGEVAITNIHSCNGPEFVLQLHIIQSVMASSSARTRVSQEANARLKFVYFPIVEGKENIDRILEKLETEGCGLSERFETFSRVSVRRLGRLLPDARWKLLPFMEPKLKVGDKARILKQSLARVKCFIETDAGFNPTPSKTDLAQHHPYTTALKNFGGMPLEIEQEINLKIYKDGKQQTLLQVEKMYQEWICQMHDRYDEEVECGDDEPVLVVNPSNKKRLGISSNILRVHKVIRRKGASWVSGQKLKILKGACAGCHKNNVYATLEYILIEGFQGDAGGEARLICRPLAVPIENGCALTLHDEHTSIDIRDSISLPISVIESGKCLTMEAGEWERVVEKNRQKLPYTIEILSGKHCQELGVAEGALPNNSTVYAGHVPPKEIVAVVHSASSSPASSSKNLNQKCIVKENLEMGMQIKFRDIFKSDQDFIDLYSVYVSPSSRKGLYGLYIFSVGCKFAHIFQKAGVYIFSFFLRGVNSMTCERRVDVKASSEVGRWGQINDGESLPYITWVGMSSPPISIACYDMYNNRMPFACVPKVVIKIISGRMVLCKVHNMKLDLSPDRLTLTIKDALVVSTQLDKIRPHYEATLVISQSDELFPMSIPCEVLPGYLQSVTIQPKDLDKQLLPGQAIKELIFEMFDPYGNHVEEGLQVQFNVDGLCFRDHAGSTSTHKVDECGCINLSGLLEVTEGYGKKVSISVLFNEKIIFKKEFQTEKRVLKTAFMVPKCCIAGSVLENIVFEIVNSEDEVDETIHDEESSGQSHTLIIKSGSLDANDSATYSFCYGRCLVRSISLPQEEGMVNLIASHSRYPELHVTIKVHVVLEASQVEPDNIQSLNLDGRGPPLHDLSVLKVPKLEQDGVHQQCSVGRLSFLCDSSTDKDVENLVVSILKDLKELEMDVHKYGLEVGCHEEALKMLNVKKVEVEEEVSRLQGSLTWRESTMELIESKADSAAAVICRLFREFHLQNRQHSFLKNVLGVVAFLGTVKSNELSRILAAYLGEDQMLAIVCNSYAAADYLEKYEQDGNVDPAHDLYAIATALGRPVCGRYLVICLEDTRPYTGEVGTQGLSLPLPTLPGGNTPPGFLGYAVNMINLGFHHMYTRTEAGHGLRETLFYCLFGELQVYETRENMKIARSCIKHGAVSLDGGIMRANGVLAVGQWEPEIQFPVVNKPTSKLHRSLHAMDNLKEVEEKKLNLRQIFNEIEEETKAHEKTLQKFENIRDRYKEFLEEKGPLLLHLGVRI